MKPYELLPHTADLRLRVFGKTLENLFSNAVRGMFKSIKPQYAKSAKKTAREVKVKSNDLNSLLVDFLSEALYLSDTRDEAYDRADFKKLTNTELDALVSGRKITGFQEEIKAVTHHGIDIKQVRGVWQTEIIFDV